jgi:hypothetical protein
MNCSRRSTMEPSIGDRDEEPRPGLRTSCRVGLAPAIDHHLGPLGNDPHRYRHQDYQQPHHTIRAMSITLPRSTAVPPACHAATCGVTTLRFLYSIYSGSLFHPLDDQSQALLTDHPNLRLPPERAAIPRLWPTTLLGRRRRYRPEQGPPHLADEPDDLVETDEPGADRAGWLRIRISVPTRSNPYAAAAAAMRTMTARPLSRSAGRDPAIRRTPPRRRRRPRCRRPSGCRGWEGSARSRSSRHPTPPGSRPER